MDYLIALDEGTTSARTIVFNERGETVSVAQREFDQHFPRPGWVEHDARQIRDVQFATAREAMKQAGCTPAQVAGIGITNQRETVVLWDRRTGEPVSPAIVWQDRRTSEAMARIAADSAQVAEIQRRTGLKPDPYFSGSKLRWLLDEVDGARAAADAGHLAFGTIDCWLLWCLSGGAVHATDASNASRTMLWNIRECAWDPELLRMFDIPESVLPEVVPSWGELGAVTVEGLAGTGVRGMLGDQQAALFGQGAFGRGDAKVTFGTGCFLLENTGNEAVESEHGLLSTVAWMNPERAVTYALEGSVFMGGASIQWLRDGLGLIEEAAQVNELAGSVPDSGGVILVPAFAGLGAPRWDSGARGALLGMTRGTTAAHVARATLEGIAHSVADVIDAMKQDAGAGASELRVDGGAAASDLLMQIQADLLGVTVARPKRLETTAFGAAAAAAIAAGVFAGPEAIDEHRAIDRRFEPALDAAGRARLRSDWARAVPRAMGWVQADGPGA